MDERALREVVASLIGRDAVLDDCAVLPDRGRFLVATTDMLHESTDFPAGMTDREIGWMAAAVTLSDIAAMGAQPAIVLLAVGLDRPQRLAGIIAGARDCCGEHGAVLAGGDLDAHRELTLVSAGVGFADRPVRRSGARPGDIVGIVGVPGRAQAALEGYTAFRSFLCTPRPRVAEGRILAEAGVTSMMDVSDGLLASLGDMREASGRGYAIETGRIPPLPGVPRDEARRFALEGGGDYGLLFTAPPGTPLPEIPELFVIGRVTDEPVILVDGRPAEIAGFRHRWDGDPPYGL
ncbi:MAG: thiamine-phosphate kinase [Methanolinea sp.]